VQAIHLTHGDSAARTLRAALAGTIGSGAVLVQRDLLTIGPCAVDPQEHRSRRLQHWGADAVAAAGDAGVDALVGPLATATDAIVLWTTSSWSDSCHTWLVLDAFARLGVPRRLLRVAQPKSPDPSWSLGRFDEAALRAALESSSPLDDDFADEGAALWRAYASPDPRRFDRARRHGGQAFPWLAETARAHGEFFPWRSDRRLRLADVDRVLLATLTAQWMPLATIVRQHHEPLGRLFNWIGDLSVFDRFASWRKKGAVEIQGDAGGPSRWELRLTRHGQHLVDEGATSVGELAPIFVGGCAINDPARPWVRLAAAADSTIEAGEAGDPGEPAV
jgi:hypothetical protein